MEGREAFEQLEHAEHGAHAGGFIKRAAILVAILAALLAIATLSANSASEKTILRQGEASDAYNEFQGNSLKAHIDDGAAAILRAAGQSPGQQAAANAKADKLEKGVRDKYDPRKDELLTKARDLEHERDAAESQHRKFQLSEGAFQIGIVLTSVALLTGAAWLAYSGGLLGVLGLILLVVGYLVK